MYDIPYYRDTQEGTPNFGKPPYWEFKAHLGWILVVWVERHMLPVKHRHPPPTPYVHDLLACREGDHFPEPTEDLAGRLSMNCLHFQRSLAAQG